MFRDRLDCLHLVVHGKEKSENHCSNTESSKYYARLQTAFARGLGWPDSHLTGLHTAAASKHLLCFSVQFLSNWSRASTYIL